MPRSATRSTIGLTLRRQSRVVAVITPPDPDELVLDELAAAGHVPADWRERRVALWRTLRSLPVRTTPPGPPIGSAGIVADREDTGR